MLRGIEGMLADAENPMIWQDCRVRRSSRPVYILRAATDDGHFCGVQRLTQNLHGDHERAAGKEPSCYCLMYST